MTIQKSNSGNLPLIIAKREALHLLEYYDEQKKFIQKIREKQGFYIDGEVSCCNLVFFPDDRLYQTFQKILGQKVMRILQEHLDDIEMELKRQGVAI